jgi:hypothetical protein
MRWTQKQREGFASLFYLLQKSYCNQSDWSNLLNECELSEEDWEEIKQHFKNSYGIKTYV